MPNVNCTNCGALNPLSNIECWRCENPIPGGGQQGSSSGSSGLFRIENIGKKDPNMCSYCHAEGRRTRADVIGVTPDGSRIGLCSHHAEVVARDSSSGGVPVPTKCPGCGRSVNPIYEHRGYCCEGCFLEHNPGG